MDLSHIFADATNGNNGNGTTKGSAFEFNAPAATSGGYPYGNVVKNLQIEQGDTMQCSGRHLILDVGGE